VRNSPGERETRRRGRMYDVGSIRTMYVAGSSGQAFAEIPGIPRLAACLSSPYVHGAWKLCTYIEYTPDTAKRICRVLVSVCSMYISYHHLSIQPAQAPSRGSGGAGSKRKRKKSKDGGRSGFCFFLRVIDRYAARKNARRWSRGRSVKRRADTSIAHTIGSGAGRDAGFGNSTA
jgi:hypothetical protein